MRGEIDDEITEEEDEQLTLEKRMEEAEQADRSYFEDDEDFDDEDFSDDEEYND